MKTSLKSGALALLVVAAAVGTGALLATVAAADNVSKNSTYYNGTPTVENESWMEGREDPTLDNQTAMLTRLSTFIIGTGGGGDLPDLGLILTGFVVFGLVGGVVAGSGGGAVAGAVLGVVAAGSLSRTGFLPEWIYVLVLMAVGIILTAAWLRASN